MLAALKRNQLPQKTRDPEIARSKYMMAVLQQSTWEAIFLSTTPNLQKIQNWGESLMQFLLLHSLP
jgi:hypothetical protein